MTTDSRDHFEEFVEENFEVPAEDLKASRALDVNGIEYYESPHPESANLTVSAMWLTWQAAKDDNWKSGNDGYDMSIHSNPDAVAWAKFFVETFPRCGVDEETMAGWFANAMMARHDFDKKEKTA